MNTIWSLTFILFTVIFLLVQLPASWAIQQLPNLPVPITFNDTTGSVWSGSSQVNSGFLSPLPARVNWQWQASSLWSGHALWHVEVQLETAQIHFNYSASTTGWLVEGELIGTPDTKLPDWAQLLPTIGSDNQRRIQYQTRW